MNPSEYRYPSETPILAGTTLVVGFCILLFAGATLFVVPLVLAVMVVMAYFLNKAHHRDLMNESLPVSPETTPALDHLARECVQLLRPGRVQFFVVRKRERNAYTFGITDPRIVVVYSSLINIMDEEELKFVLGHELGHVALNHTWLNTLLGGMSGIPLSFEAAIILIFAFRWWNRACEYSADRAGLLACGNLQKAITALVKIQAGRMKNQKEIDNAIQMIDSEDDSLLNVLGETLSTHPMTIRRIEQLKKFAASSQYQRLLKQKSR